MIDRAFIEQKMNKYLERVQRSLLKWTMIIGFLFDATRDQHGIGRFNCIRAIG